MHRVIYFTNKRNSFLSPSLIQEWLLFFCFSQEINVSTNLFGVSFVAGRKDSLDITYRGKYLLIEGARRFKSSVLHWKWLRLLWLQHVGYTLVVNHTLFPTICLTLLYVWKAFGNDMDKDFSFGKYQAVRSSDLPSDRVDWVHRNNTKWSKTAMPLSSIVVE